MSDFWESLVFFCHQKVKKRYLKKSPDRQTLLEGPSARKTGLFFPALIQIQIQM